MDLHADGALRRLPGHTGYDVGFLREARGRVALIGGRRDQHGDLRRLEALVASLPAPPWLRLLDTDHFFGGALDRLAAAVREALVAA